MALPTGQAIKEEGLSALISKQLTCKTPAKRCIF